MMYCYRCGQRLAEGARHCPTCGAAIFYNENGPLPDVGNGESTQRAAEQAQTAYTYGEQTTGEYRSAGDSDNSQAQNTYQGGNAYQNGTAYQGGTAYQNGTTYQGGTAYQGGAYQGYPNGGYQAQQPPATRQDSFALAALVSSILALVMCCVPQATLPLSICAIILSIIGMKSVRRKSMAVVALILGIICLIAGGFLFALSLYYRAHPEILQEIQQQLESLSGMEGFEFFGTSPVQ